LAKYKRIEVHAYHRRVTVVSGAWRPDELLGSAPARTTNEVSLNNTDADEPVEPDSPEGQMILAEAVLSLQRRLAPEARALVCADQDPLGPNHSNQNAFYLTAQSFLNRIYARALRFNRKEK